MPFPLTSCLLKASSHKMSAGHWTHHQELKIQITQIQRPGKSRCHIPVHIHIHLSAQKRNLVVIIVINSVSSMLTFVDILNMQRPMTERSVEEERRHAVGRDVSIEEIFTHLIKPSLITKRLYTHVNRCLEAIHHHAAEPKMQFSGLDAEWCMRWCNVSERELRS